MKKLIFTLILATLSAFSTAYAGDLSPAFAADNGRVFTVKADDLGFTCSPGAVTVTLRNTDARSFPDSSGAVCAKVVNSAGFYGSFVRQPGTAASTQVYHRANWIEAYCSASGTVLSYAVNAGPTVLNDGCQTHAVIKARAN